MFTFAMVTGVKNGWLPAETYGPAARKAWLALVSYLDADGNVREVCVGTGEAATSGAGDERDRSFALPRSPTHRGRLSRPGARALERLRIDEQRILG